MALVGGVALVGWMLSSWLDDMTNIVGLNDIQGTLDYGRGNYMPDFIGYASVITPLWVRYCRCYLALQDVPHPS